jgi:hypothetical protein
MYNIKPDSLRTLKERRERTYGRMSALNDIINSGRQLTPGERDEWDKLDRDLRGIDATIKLRKDAKRRDKGASGYEGDSRTEGRTKEVLSRDQSFATWVDRAAENGIRVTTEDGAQIPITGSGFDLNAY